MTRNRRRELAMRYAEAVHGVDDRTRRHEWLKHLATLWQEDGDYGIFRALRARPRANGARIDNQLVSGELEPRKAYRLIRRQVGDLYCKGLTRYRIANIDITTPAHRRMCRRITFETLQTFQGVDPGDKTAVCRGMAKTWHRFISGVHARYGLPSVQAMRKVMREESDAEVAVVDNGNFQTPMTPDEVSAWEAQLA